MGRSRTDTPGRKIVRLELTEFANARINAVCDARAMLKNKLVERVLTWFTALEESAQSAVIARIDKGLAADYAKVLRKLADDVEQGRVVLAPPPTTPEEPKKRTELASVKRRGDKAAQVVTIPGSAR